ncbi:MAG TPA: glycosyl hydrolase [Terriglobia bacterium]
MESSSLFSIALASALMHDFPSFPASGDSPTSMNPSRRACQVLVLVLVVVLGSQIHGAKARADEAGSLASLHEAFVRPPEDAKIMVRWWWFGPSVTHSELQQEMRLMRAGGIGGFEVQTTYPLALDDPSHNFENVAFLSEAHLDALRFVSSEARRLGLRMDLTLGSGWPYGGPSVPITEAAGRLRFEAVAVNAGTPSIPLPYIGTGEKLLAVFLAKGDPARFAVDSAQQLSDVDNGRVRLPDGLQDPHVALFFIASRTGQTVKRAAVGAEGFVLDHYDRVALDNYLTTVGARFMQAFPSNPPRAVFCDSLEVYTSDWTGDFLEEFQKRRGYDLKPYLPALVGEIGPKTRAIRHDWGQTLTELFADRFVAPLEQWARNHHTLLRAQLYGTPPAVLSNYKLIDLPEGEGAHWKVFAPTRWASSASHLYGRPVTSSETWTWLHSPAFRATPLDLKAEADVHFLEGINQLVGHGWPYSPEAAGEPGWRFYAAAALNSHNPWWLIMPDLALYLQRVSFLLRQGRPVNDVALYVPTDDAWARFSPGEASVSETVERLLEPNLIGHILEAGYGFDLIDDDAINRLAEVKDRALVVNGNRYPIIILPGVERIPLETLDKLASFARLGGTLVATGRAPSLAPGLTTAETETRQIGELSQRLFDGTSAPGHLVMGDGHELGTVLNGFRPPDVSFSPPASDVGFVHRTTGWAEIYFLANTGNHASTSKATFRVQSLDPEWWDPFTGQAFAADVLTRSSEGTTLALDLEPYESRVLIFSGHTASGLTPRARSTGASPDMPAPVDLSMGWKVTFLRASSEIPTNLTDQDLSSLAEKGSSSARMDRLRSWTDDDATRFFSGLVLYEKTFNVPPNRVGSSPDLWLDFGEGTAVPPLPSQNEGMQAWFDAPVREAAVVYVNGQRAGSVWHPPYTVEVTGRLRPGENQLRIVVANSAINEMAGAALPDYRLLNSRYGERFTPQDMNHLAPLPSGLLGGIHLKARPVERDLSLRE